MEFAVLIKFTTVSIPANKLEDCQILFLKIPQGKKLWVRFIAQSTRTNLL